MEKGKLPSIMWLWIPLIWMAGQLLAEFSLSPSLLHEMHGENSVHEWLQVALLIGGFVIGIHLLWSLDKTQNRGLVLWIALAALGCFWVAGEEISWGQWIFFWETPEYWAALNQQGETNLHNTSRLLNHIPRYVLQIGILVGGIILPALYILKPHWLPARLTPIYPPRQVWVTAYLLLFAALAHKAGKMFFDTKLFTAGSEVEELYIYYFVFLYMVALWHRFVRP